MPVAKVDDRTRCSQQKASTLVAATSDSTLYPLVDHRRGVAVAVLVSRRLGANRPRHRIFDAVVLRARSKNRSKKRLKAVTVFGFVVQILTMKNPIRTGTITAIAAASLFASACGSKASSKTTTPTATEKTAAVACLGINACKAQGSCHTEKNSCKGQNTCKGTGVMEAASADECTTKGGTVQVAAAAETTPATEPAPTPAPAM